MVEDQLKPKSTTKTSKRRRSVDEKNQQLTQLDNGKFLLKASLANTEQLRWWLLGFGNRVEVLKPKSLRNEFAEITKGLSKIYK